MQTFAGRCFSHQPDRLKAHLEASQQLAEQWRASGVQRVRFAWADLMGHFRSKTLQLEAAVRALSAGVGMAGTLMLKDHADKTAFPVFDEQALAKHPFLKDFAHASNVQLLAEPSSSRRLPWDNTTAWIRCDPYHSDGSPVQIDARTKLLKALSALGQQGMSLRCGLEVEFHVYKILDQGGAHERADLDPRQAEWPAEPPALQMLHPGYRLISDEYQSLADPALAIIERTILALGLPLQSLEIEFGPSQFEAVFDATDALSAADNMLILRNTLRQALRREGYYVSFVCRPPFPNIMSSGWHLHQSLVDVSGKNLFAQIGGQASKNPSTQAQQASDRLSPLGCQYLAGLLKHAGGTCALAVPTVNGYERFRPHALAPQAAVWGFDNRGAMLRVIGGHEDPATRLENRIGEPLANPYLFMASQIYAGLDGITQKLKPPPASHNPYAIAQANQVGLSDAGSRLSARATGLATTQDQALHEELKRELPQELAEALETQLPRNLELAVQALEKDPAMLEGFGADFLQFYAGIKRFELHRYQQASDAQTFQRREYFSRF